MSRILSARRLFSALVCVLMASACTETAQRSTDREAKLSTDAANKPARQPFFIGGKRPSTSARVVSMAPSITEIVFALGEGQRLVGVTRFCDYPPRRKPCPRWAASSTPASRPWPH